MCIRDSPKGVRERVRPAASGTPRDVSIALGGVGEVVEDLPVARPRASFCPRVEQMARRRGRQEVVEAVALVRDDPVSYTHLTLPTSDLV